MTTTAPTTPLTEDSLPADPTALTTVGTYTRYAEAQSAVDLLSDRGFPVERTQIVGHDVRTVETVVGRMTNGRAALMGIASGAWFGLFVALLIGLFTFRPFWFLLIVTGVLFGAAWGALFGFVGHWATRGRRDFSSVQSLSATRYDVMVRHESAEDALRILRAGRFPDATTAGAPAAAQA